ncbi:MAG: InlB B-repeat-containing protein, partial [Eubacteriales bacterium]
MSTKNRFVSMLLVICMTMTMIPASAFAAVSDKTAASDTQNPFDDVNESSWFYSDVMYALHNQLFQGITATKFDPQGNMTRAMYVTVMGRIAEIDPDVYKNGSGFSDVVYGSWNAPYISWAEDKNIAGGIGGGLFNPDGLVTREQMASMTVRFFAAYGIPLPEDITDTEPNDMPSVSDWAQDDVLKLWRCGLLQGYMGAFNPANNTTRAEAAAFCGRIDEIVEQWHIDTGVKDIPVNTVGTPSGGSQNPGIMYYGDTYYTISFDTMGGAKLSGRSVREGRALNNLPVPYKADSIFIGWCYDAGLHELVSASDTIGKNLTLYAKYEKSGALTQTQSMPFAHALDQGTNFTVLISGATGMTEDELNDAIVCTNLSSNENKKWFRLTQNGDTVAVSGLNYLGNMGAPQDGFTEGSAYKITLEDERLSFSGQDSSAREYDFTIARQEIMNAALSDELIYIPIGNISNLTVNGSPAASASIPVITVRPDGSQSANGTASGSFTYNGALDVGDTVVIYSGNELPAMDSAADGDDNAFIEITEKNGNNYAYKGADVENVLFTPDILPVSISADTDGNANDSSMTVAVEAMTYTDDCFTAVGLDSMTTVDSGDFIAFYSGTLLEDGTISDGMIQNYAEITSVECVGGSYIIAYRFVTMSEMQQAMAAYKNEPLSGDELLANVDVAAIERNAELQAQQSGFAEEAGMYLAALALETDSFTELSAEYDLKSVEMQLDGEPITQETLQLMGAKKVQVKLNKLQASLETELQHFENLSGLRLMLEVGVEVEITVSDNIKIVIEISGFFEQEVKVELGVDGDAIWKWWGIFPYIAEYEVTAYTEFYEYTGIQIEATIVTKENKGDGFAANNDEIEKIGRQIKDLMQQKDKRLGDGSKTVAESLSEKYSDMLENESDWVKLFSIPILEKEFHILTIIAVELNIEFIVTANLNISLGLDFWYENAKRYVYTVDVFAKKVTSDIISLAEERYEFEFYVMGTMGLRAGLKLGVSVGLISTKLASVGFAAEGGVYTRLWGYFYYQLVYTASAGKSTSYCGALLVELGAYAEITFEAQAFNGTFKYNPTLYSNEWPLLTAGNRASITDFTMAQEDIEGVRLKQYIRTAMLADELFSMHYFDLKDGEEHDAIYDDAVQFKIEMTNPKFSYNAADNMLTVNPGADDVKLEGTMIITWISFPLAFTSAPIQRKVSLYWDNLRDGYAIAPYTNGGSYVPIIVKQYQEAFSTPENPVKTGYTFDGWFEDTALTRSYTFPALMPNADTSVYAKWAPATDTIYTVEHYLQVLGSSQYTLTEQKELHGTTDSMVTPETNSYTGYKTPASSSLVIRPDGSSVLRYYYDLQTYTVTFKPGEVGGSDEIIKLKYGSPITAPIFGAAGYIFDGWIRDGSEYIGNVSEYMGDEDLTYTAQWKKDTRTEYRIEYYVQQTDGRYVLQSLEKGVGVTGQQIYADGLRQDELYAISGVI